MTEEADLSNIFSEYSALLTLIGATPQDAFDRMLETQQCAVTNYAVDYLPQLWHNNLITHTKKYEELVSFYQRDIHPFDPYYLDETYSSTRSPDLITSSTSSGSGTSDTQRNQSMITESAPGVTTTSTHSVNPYNDSGLRPETEDETTETGSNTTTQSFSGSPDHISTTSAASSLVSQSGSDLLETSRLTIGRNGRRFLMSELTDSALYTLDKLDILDIIIEDIAEEVFLQMWII